MSQSDLKDTQPSRSAAADEINSGNPPSKKKFPSWLAIFVFVILVAIGILAGYGSGMGQRYSAQKVLVSAQNQEQYQLGIQAMQAGQYEVAKQHFESVIQNNPNFPGVKSAYADLLLHMQITPTLSPTPTPAVSPTPDLRSAEDRFKGAQASLKTGDWDGTISQLDSLRKIAPTYQTAQVDGMYYMALYQRGLSKIQASSCANINLEGGIYDLTMAEQFGPLDEGADSLRTYARLFITASSFWDQDWVQAQNYFAQVMAAYPDIRDSSCVSASDRWRQATIKYADQLAAKGDFCGAENQYIAAFTINSTDNKAVFPTATAVRDQCNGGSGGGGGNSTPTETPVGETPTLGGATSTPGGAPTPTLAPPTPTLATPTPTLAPPTPTLVSPTASPTPTP